MIKTTQIAADRAHDETKTVLPAEVARGAHIQNPPSLRALKLMHLMIGTAGGRMAEDVLHHIRLSDIRKIEGMAHHDRESLKPLFIELQTTVISYDEPDKQQWTVGGLLDEAQIDYRHEISGDLLVSWYFGRTFRRLADESCHWAIIDRQTVFALTSKYSVLLFQHISSLVNLTHVQSKNFNMWEVRELLGVAEGKLPRWNDVNRFALKPAIAEINHTSRLTLTATPHKIGRSVASVTISWVEKPQEAKQDAKRELDRPKVGRKARRDGTAETLALAFPNSGTIRDAQPWDRIARDNAPKLEGGHVPDLRELADTFRKWCAEKSIRLDANCIEKTFTTWSKSYSSR